MILTDGFWWLDVTGTDRDQIMQRWLTVQAWVREWPGRVWQRATEEDEDTGQVWTLLEVANGPVEWELEFARPSRGFKGMSKGDTVQAPEPDKDILDQAGDAIHEAESSLKSLIQTLTTVTTVVGWGAGLGVAVIIGRAIFGGRK